MRTPLHLVYLRRDIYPDIFTADICNSLKYINHYYIMGGQIQLNLTEHQKLLSRNIENLFSMSSEKVMIFCILLVSIPLNECKPFTRTGELLNTGFILFRIKSLGNL